jgi:enhancing lycopene biosynthesis protein 2
VKRRAGVLLCGCGAFDGTDPHEAVLSMLCLQEAGLEVVPLVFDGPQFHVVDHTTAQEQEGQARQMMSESARLVRGKLYSLQEISPKLLEMLVIPGGQGPVKSLLTGFGSQEERCIVPEVLSFFGGFHDSGGVFGAISLAEFVLSAALGPWPEGKGCFDLGPEDVLVDPAQGRVLAPGHTQATSLPQLARGIRNLIEAMVRLSDDRTA